MRHVLRKHNKMTDGLANIAIDSTQTHTFSTTSPPLHRLHFTATEQHLHNDFNGLERPLIFPCHREIHLTHYQRASIP